MTDQSDLKRLHRAADIVEIKEALTRYCRGIDRADLEIAKSAYHEDAIEDHGPFHGRAWDFLEFVVPIMGNLAVSTRHITNHLVEFDGDVALSEASFIAIQREAESEIDDMLSGRYLDRFERRSDGWRIASRLVVMDWWRRDERNALPFEHEASLKWGKPGSDDPLYARRAEVLG